MVMDGEVAKEVSHLPHFHIIHYCTAIHQMKGHSMEHSMHNNDSISEVPVQAVCTTEVDTVVEAVWIVLVSACEFYIYPNYLFIT